MADRDKAITALQNKRTALLNLQQLATEQLSGDALTLAIADIQAMIGVIDQEITDLQGGAAFTPPTDTQVTDLQNAVNDVAAIVAANAAGNAFIDAATEIMNKYNA